MFTVSKSDEKLMVELLEKVHNVEILELTEKDIVEEAKRLPKTLRQDMSCSKLISADFKMAIGVIR